MAKLIPVPWLQWRRFRVSGLVCEEGSRRPLPGLRVLAFDKDVLSDDFLGESITDAAGRFEIRFTDADFKDVLESRPDIYLTLLAADRQEPIFDTSYAIRHNATDEEYFEIQIPADFVAGA